MKKGNKSIFRTNKIWIKCLLSLILPLFIIFENTDLLRITELGKNAPLDSYTAHLDQRIPALMDLYKIPGVSIAVVDQGKISWSKAFGYADLDTGRKMTKDTYLRVQSISKPITAWGVMKLVENNNIELDEPISRYIKNWQFPDQEISTSQITIRQLLTHTAGFPIGDFFNYYSPHEEIPTLERSLYKEAYLIQSPGSSFSYSNTGFNLLELIIEEVTGQDFSEYMLKVILLPLGMTHSSYFWREEFHPPIPNGYDLHGKSIPIYVYPEKGSGGLFATVEDIATFMIAGMPDYSETHQVLSKQSIEKLYSPMVTDMGIYSLVFDAYGLGHYIETLSDGKIAISHGGQGTGWMTHFHAVPETGDGIVILTNSQRSWPFIATLLSDWAKWNGLPKPGMSLILVGQKIIWGFISLLWFGMIWSMWKFVEDLIQKKREFSPFCRQSHRLRIVQVSISFVLLIGVLWSVNQDYLFISSVFPIASNWLGITTFILTISLILSALFPEKVSYPNG